MSMTTTIQVGERGFWATKDAFGAWMGYLVEEIADRAPALLDPALSALAEQWRVAAVGHRPQRILALAAGVGDLAWHTDGV